MERDVFIALALSTIVLTLIGGLYLRPGKPAAPDEQIAEHADYSPNDVRYKYQLEAEKAAKRNKGKKPPPVEDAQPAPEPSENEAPPVDDGGDEPAEEPPIE